MVKTNKMEEVHLTTIKPRNNLLLLAQEISFAKVLACNDKRLRDRGLRRLRKWFMTRSQGSIDFTKEDHMRIWKGLFYCMWMSDKPLIQEELSEEISGLIHSFASFKASLLFVETFFAALSVEWFGIDQLRLDKFMMLVRRFMRQSFELVARIGWPEKEVQQLVDVYQKAISEAPLGLSMHVIEVFCEELAKVGKGELSNEVVLQFVTMFANIMATLKDGRLISQITRYVFLHLMRQTELGVEHQMKFSAWKQYGFPGGDVDAAEKIEVDSLSEEDDCEESDQDEEGDDEEEGKEMGVDARAGRVDVLLPPLDFNTQDLLEVLRELRNKRETTTKARKTLIQLINKYEKLAAGSYPLGLHKVDLPSKVNKKKEVSIAAKRLLEEEQKLIYGDQDSAEGGLSNATSKKKRKLKMNTWEVSDACEGNETEKVPETSQSWEVSESEDKSMTNATIQKKRKPSDKQLENENSLDTDTKRAKLSSFSVSDSKDNSFSSPVTSTPKNQSKEEVLKKTNTKQNSQGKPIATPEKLKNTKRKCKNKKNTKIEDSTLNSTNNTGEHVTEINGSQVQTTQNTPKPVNNSKSKDDPELLLNTSESSKNNGWGGEWDEDFQEGEYEMFIPNKKYVEKRKSLGLPYPVSSFVQKSAEKLTPVNRLKNGSTPGSQKKLSST